MSQVHLTRGDFATESDTSAFGRASVPSDAAKAGARKNKTDAETIQEMHDKCMKMADGAHCAQPDMSKAEVEKRGSRHSAADMAKIKTAHDCMVALGAACGPMKS